MSTDAVEAFLPLRPAHFHILLTVTNDALHGYGIRREVEERTNGRIILAAGTLYETLQRLEKRGLIDEVDSPEHSSTVSGSRWRFYRATPLGRRVVLAEVGRLEADLAAARGHLADGGS